MSRTTVAGAAALLITLSTVAAASSAPVRAAVASDAVVATAVGTLDVSSAKVEVDRAITVTGRFAPGKRQVRLQIRYSGSRRWYTRAKTSTNARGAFRFDGVVLLRSPLNPLPRPITVRGYAPRTNSRAASATELKTLRVVNPRPGVAGNLSVASVGSDERLGDNESGQNGYDVSGDGRYVVFDSRASWADPSRTRLDNQIFLRDRAAGRTTLLSRGTDGRQPRAASFTPLISADGDWVVFWSEASNLVRDDDNGDGDLFWWSRSSGRTTLVRGVPAGGGGIRPLALSADGRFLAFASSRPDLAPLPTDAAWDLYVLDRFAGTAEQIPTPATPVGPGVDAMFAVSMSDDGRFLAYAVDVDERNPWNDSNNRELAFTDRLLDTTVSIPMDPAGARGEFDDLGVSSTAMTADGSLVAYSAPVPDADSYRTNDRALFLWDSATGLSEQIPGTLQDSTTDVAYGPSHGDLSADGRFVLFQTYVDSDAQYVRVDRSTVEDEILIPRPPPPSSGWWPSWSAPILSNDGSTAVFAIDAHEQYVPRDVNKVEDVFVWDDGSSG